MFTAKKFTAIVQFAKLIKFFKSQTIDLYFDLVIFLGVF